MTENKIVSKRKPTSFKLKVLLLVLQILLPFGMYFAFVSGQTLILAIASAALLISMIVLVGLK